MKKTKTTRNSFLLVLTALIWGTAFVAQATGGDAIGAFAFNAIRSYVGFLILLPVILLMDRLGVSRKPQTPKERKVLIRGGISCGIVLCIAGNFQQVGITLGTQPGKAGFLTACYIILVPLLGLFLGKKCGWNIWLGVVLTVAGLYLLCINGALTLQRSDLLVIICAFCFAVHILIIDHFSPMTDGVRMSCIQFLVVGILSSIPAFWVDLGHSAAGISLWLPKLSTSGAWISILYAGIMSSGVAYTLQIIGQEDVNPTVASLLMSLESVFSVLAGWVLLHQTLSVKELTGCLLIFAAVCLAQIPLPEK